MSAYQTVVVGTDGSASSFIAVDRAASIAANLNATLVIVCAYHPTDEQSLIEARDTLKDEAYQVVGSAPAEDTVSRAKDRALRQGATKVETIARIGEPVDILNKIVAERSADLVVVGNRGLNTLAGRILGSVPSSVARKSAVDVLIVHTT